MKNLIFSVSVFLLLAAPPARADLWGGDLPLLSQIVFNTLHTMYELQQQTEMLNDQLDGIKDRLNRIQTIAEVVQPSQWDRWRDPAEAMRRIQLIYGTLPKEYRSEKSDQVEEELSKAMNLISRVSRGAESSFRSGKEMEERASDSSPGVAQKLTASGVGTLISMEAQTQIIQSHIVSLLAQTLADANEKETRQVTNSGHSYGSISENLNAKTALFSKLALGMAGTP